MIMKMKILTICCICFLAFICVSNAQLGDDPKKKKISQKLMTPLATLAVQSGSSADNFAKKTVEEILKIISPTLNLLHIKTRFKLSSPLMNLLQSRSIANITQYYKGFNMIPGMAELNVPLFQFLHMAVSFDSPMYTANTLEALKMLYGNSSIAPLLNTTDAALRSRSYLTDVLPVLRNNLPRILNETRERFFIFLFKIPEKYCRLLIKNPAIIDEILLARKNMAFATVGGSASEIQAASLQFQTASGKVSEEMGKIILKAVSMNGMRIVDATQKCNISLSELKMKTLIQFSLKCIGLPEDFPLLKFIPAQNFPVKALTTKLGDLSTELNIPFSSLIQLTPNVVIGKYMQAQTKTPLHEPVFYAAKKQGLSVMDMDNKTLLEIAIQLTQLNASLLSKVSNASLDVIGEMRSTTFKQLPDIVEELSDVRYPTRYFYFLSLDSIMRLLDNKVSVNERIIASETISVPVNAEANAETAKILGKTKVELESTNLMEFIGLITNKDDQTVAGALKLAPENVAFLKKISLKTAEELHRTFGIGLDLVLNRPSVVTMSKNRLFVLISTPIRALFGGMSQAKAMDSTLPKLMAGNPIVKSVVHLAAKKMKINDIVLNVITLNEMKFALNNEQLVNRTIFGILQDLAKLSKEKIPSPDFKSTIRNLSAKKSIPLSSLKGLSLLGMIKRVTSSAWQLPVLIKMKKGQPDLKMQLKNTSQELRTILENVLPELKTYDVTIDRLLNAMVGLDDVSHTATRATHILNFLKGQLGIKEKFPLGINPKTIGNQTFLKSGLPLLLKSLNGLKKKTYAAHYLRYTQNMSWEMYELLKSVGDVDIGQELYQSARDLVLYNEHESMNRLFQLEHFIDKMRKRFTEKPLKDIIRVCKIKHAAVSDLTIKQVFQTCFNKSSEEFIKASFNGTKLFNPFINDVSVAEMKDILGLGLQYFDKSLDEFVNSKTEEKYGALFVPLKDAFAAAGMKEGQKMSLLVLFKNPKFAHFNSMGFLQRNFVYGRNLNFLKSHSIADLATVVGISDKDFSKTNAYGLMKKFIFVLKDDPKRCEKLSRILSLCNKEAYCFISKNSYDCRCQGGFDGDGFKTCIDKCQTMKCNEETTCITLPGVGASCKCRNSWQKMRNGKCARVQGHMVKVSKLKLKQEYKKEYSDKSSKAFKIKAVEIEGTLFNAICKKIGCIAVVVTSIEKGSLVVEFSAVFSSATNATAKDVEAAVAVAIQSSDLDVLIPDKTTKPKAQQADACQSGAADCGSNEDCLPTVNGGYTCTCSKGYEKKSGVCKKSGGISFVIIIIIIVVAFVLIVTVIACVIWRWKRKRGQSSAKYTMAYTSNESDKVQLTGGDYAFSYGGEKDKEKTEEIA